MLNLQLTNSTKTSDRVEDHHLLCMTLVSASSLINLQLDTTITHGATALKLNMKKKTQRSNHLFYLTKFIFYADGMNVWMGASSIDPYQSSVLRLLLTTMEQMIWRNIDEIILSIFLLRNIFLFFPITVTVGTYCGW